MYKMIGADGRVYGPVSLDQLREWIKEGRANALTLVQSPDAPDWKPLGTLAEFSDLFAPAPPPMPPPPPPSAPATDAVTAQVLARDYTVQTVRWISGGWDIVMSDFWVCVGAAFVAGLIASMSIIGLVLGGPMLGGLYAMFLKKRRGQPITFGDAFVGFNLFVPLMLAYIVMSLLSGLGFLLCLLPGIYLCVAWTFTLMLVIDRKLDFWPAMELSRKMVNKHWWGIFGFLLVCALINLAGVLACCIGWLVTMPITFAATACAYEDIFGASA